MEAGTDRRIEGPRCPAVRGGSGKCLESLRSSCPTDFGTAAAAAGEPEGSVDPGAESLAAAGVGEDRKDQIGVAAGCIRAERVARPAVSAGSAAQLLADVGVAGAAKDILAVAVDTLAVEVDTLAVEADTLAAAVGSLYRTVAAVSNPAVASGETHTSQ
jgi:hypothetical protein